MGQRLEPRVNGYFITRVNDRLPILSTCVAMIHIGMTCDFSTELGIYCSRWIGIEAFEPDTLL